MKNLNEIWKDVVGYEDKYEISNFGNARSKTIYVTDCLGITRKRTGRILKSHITKFGYIKFSINKNGEEKKRFAHRLVMAAFAGESQLHVDHLNGIKTDNRLENLEYVTNRENACRYRLRTKKYVGIYWNEEMKKWVAHITIKYKNVYLGGFVSPEEASDAYKRALKFHIENPDHIYKNKPHSSKYTGVCFSKDKNKWTSSITINRVVKRFGAFKCETAAFIARQKYLSQVNFISK